MSRNGRKQLQLERAEARLQRDVATLQPSRHQRCEFLALRRSGLALFRGAPLEEDEGHQQDQDEEQDQNQEQDEDEDPQGALVGASWAPLGAFGEACHLGPS